MRPARLLAVCTVMLFAACDREPTGPDALRAPDARSYLSATAVYLVDTGPGGVTSTSSSSLFSQGATNCSPQPACSEHFQFLAGKFTLGSEATVESVQTWLNVSFAGSVTVRILPDNAGVPGATALASATYPLSSNASFAHTVFPDFNVVLQPGTYWVSFEPVANTGFHGAIQGGAEDPLPDYAFFNEGNNRWVAYSVFNQNPTLAMRIAGTPSTPPDPTETPSEMITELRTTIAGLDLAHGTRNALDATLRAALRALAVEDTGTACESLGDFLDQVRALRRKIDATDAAMLSAEATDIRAEIGC